MRSKRKLKAAKSVIQICCEEHSEERGRMPVVQRGELECILKELDTEVPKYFTPTELDELARECGFVQRQRELTGSAFFDLVVFNVEALKSQSLNGLCAILKSEHGIEIGRQSLNERFNAKALEFLKLVIEKLLQRQMPNSIAVWQDSPFRRILIKDSTCFQVAESMVDTYPGSGGSGSGASVRIQFEYDILNGKITDLSVSPFNVQDATNSVATVELVREGDLIIRDLGYMSNLGVLKQIVENLGHYLCRLSPSTNVYELKEDEYVRVDFHALWKYMRTHGLACIEKEVYLGEVRLRTRLVVYMLPEEEVGKRLRDAYKNQKKKGRGEPTDEYKARLALSLVITSANSELITMGQAWPLYRLRWQVELIFKTWKSICQIQEVKDVCLGRLNCYILAKLAMIVIGWRILKQTAARLLNEEGKAFSFIKGARTFFSHQIHALRNVLLLGVGQLEVFMERFYELSRTYHILEKRLEEPTSHEILLTFLHIEPDSAMEA